MCTHSVAGALPLGLLITSDEKESTLKHGFTMLKNCLPDDAFYGNGLMVGPKIILTDNCQEERNALKAVWPSGNSLLCIFFMFFSKHGDGCWIRIIKSTKRIDQEYWVYLRKPYMPVLRICLNSAMKSFLTKRKRHIPLRFRTLLLVRGNQTNNFVESQFLVLKDVILGRVKECNLVALFDRLTVHLENHYEEKLLSVIDGSFDGHYRRRFMGKRKQKNYAAKRFKVRSEDTQKNSWKQFKRFQMVFSKYLVYHKNNVCI